MGNRTASRGSGTRRAVKKRVEKSGQEKPVALTLKVDTLPQAEHAAGDPAPDEPRHS